MSSEHYFSAAASAKAKQTGRLARYRSYKVGTYYDKISERYNHIDIFELQALHVPLDFEKIQYYRENERETPITPSGEDGHIVALTREAHYADQQQQGADHVVLPLQFTAKRFKFASREDLELWKAESEEEGIIFVGPIPAIAPVREILEHTGEGGLLHQASSDRDDAIKEAAATTATGRASHSLYTADPYNYQENYFPSGPCGHYECGLCYGSLIQFHKPKIFVLGYAENAPEVITIRVKDAKTKKLKYMYKLAKIMQISTMLSEITNSMDAIDAIDSPNLDDYYNELQ